MPAIEVISFKSFMAAGSSACKVASIYPSSHIMHMLDGGLFFFGGLAVVLLGLVLLEKSGLEINEKNLRWLMLPAILAAILWSILKFPLPF
jgi:uncharacterized BrkB/YihY/UPF0761 family membrane protein